MTTDGPGEIPSESDELVTDPNASWAWLQDRCGSRSNFATLASWMDEELEALEADFRHWITAKSALRELRSGRSTPDASDGSTELEN